MTVTLLRPDGLHILARATVLQLAQDEQLQMFATGLVVQSLEPLLNAAPQTTLTQALHQTELPPANALLTTLLALDAEVSAVVDDETRKFPLSGFLSYRSRLLPDQYPLNTVRLPPLNPDGHYRLVTREPGHYLAVRLDIHPRLKVAGHVRIAVGSSARPPERLMAIEQRLDRQYLTQGQIDLALETGNEALPVPLTAVEIETLSGLLADLITE